MQQTGITTNGNPVFGGVFPMVGTHGIPLEVVLNYFKERGIVVDWPGYIAGALKDGHNPRTVKGRILAAGGDVYGGKYAQAVAERIDAHLAHNRTLS